MFNAHKAILSISALYIFKYLIRKISGNTSHHPYQSQDCHEAKQQCKPKRSNVEVNLPYHGRYIFSSALTNPLRSILAQQSSTWTDRHVAPTQKTNTAPKETRISLNDVLAGLKYKHKINLKKKNN
jgi:hypothetical protein